MTTDPRAAVDQFERALASGDADAVADAALAVERLQSEPRSVLAALGSALRDGDHEAGRVLASTLRRRYDEREAPETGRLRRSELARRQVARPAERRTLSEHGVRLATARTERAGALVQATGYLAGSGRDTGRREDLLARIDRLGSRERTLRETETAAADITDPLDLPASVSVTGVGLDGGTVSVGRPRQTGVTVANAGDSPAESVELRFEAPDGVSLSPGAIPVGTVDGRASVTETLSLTAETVDSHAVTVRVRAGSGTVATGLFEFSAVEAPASPVAALDRNGNGLIDTAEAQRAIAAWQDGEPLAVLDDRPPTAEEVRRAVAAWADSRFV